MMKATLLAAALAVAIPAAVMAEPPQITTQGAYARSSGPSARTGAAFMVLHNHGDSDDRLIGARSPAAERVELHTHITDVNGVMKMREIEGGIAIPAGAEHLMERGGDHIMFLGLTAPFEQGAMIPVTLVFEQAGEVGIEVPVDLDRMPGGRSGSMGHDAKGGDMGHGGDGSHADRGMKMGN